MTEAMQRLQEYGVCLVEEGLSDEEFARIEERFGFEFADDHRAFLAAGLPTNAGQPPMEPGVIVTHPHPWPTWRDLDSHTLHDMLDWPETGVLFDVENNEFWPPAWGPRPETTEAATEVARERLASVPKLVPVYGHRYLPAGRGTSGYPVFSVWGTDIIYYGVALADYIEREFGEDRDWRVQRQPHTVEFWTAVVERGFQPVVRRSPIDLVVPDWETRLGNSVVVAACALPPESPWPVGGGARVDG
jgi:hypothetical protein